MINKPDSMKIIGLEIQKLEIAKFHASKMELELLVHYSDGMQHQITKTVTISDPEKSGLQFIEDMKSLVSKSGRQESNFTGQVNLVLKREDKLKHEIALFFSKAGKHLLQISNKKDASGYIELIRTLKNLKLDLLE